uniref:BZIP domain-containing protein n=1 Tax=Timspurckia oligopyrenoides TaxID=708627 RepID=A0A7S0ZC50_9RHOD|mmetsp:Transcript_11968/g.21677  ORF Transcript_11968/g.21677 Transcript_11968/m.21677 type:complete len:153 (+) Transcript_11968:309-767(+)
MSENSGRLESERKKVNTSPEVRAVDNEKVRQHSAKKKQKNDVNCGTVHEREDEKSGERGEKLNCRDRKHRKQNSEMNRKKEQLQNEKSMERMQEDQLARQVESKGNDIMRLEKELFQARQVLIRMKQIRALHSGTISTKDANTSSDSISSSD